MLIYNKLTEIFADFRHFGRKLILLIFSYLHTKNSKKTAYRQHAGGGGLEIIANKKLRPTAARAAVHVVNIKPSTFNYHLFLYGGSAVGETASPPPSTACQSGVYTRLSTTREWLVLIAKQPVSAAFQPPMAHCVIIIQTPEIPDI